MHYSGLEFEFEGACKFLTMSQLLGTRADSEWSRQPKWSGEGKLATGSDKNRVAIIILYVIWIYRNI